MKTDALIAALAADTHPQRPIRRQMAAPLALGAALALGAFALFWGPRPDLAAALGSLAALKTAAPLALGALALALALALAHPAAGQRRAGAALGGALALLLAALVWTLAQAGLAGMVAALAVPDLLVCLGSVPLLALPLMAGLLRGLSAGASVHPRRSGAAAGLAAGALAAAIYSLFCTKDMALFVLPAYGTAIALVTLLGASIGPRALRW